MVMIGCASGVSRTKEGPKEKFCCSVNNPVGDIQVILTEEGKADLKDNLKFNPDELKNHLERAFIASSLMKKELKDDLPSLVVEVKDIRVRSNFSAIMWGFMAGNDHIIGDIVIKDKNGLEFDRFEVSASYALGGLGGGQDSARMDWLYEAFSEETVKELTKTGL
jgi:hypothetical protein